jgi:CO/xanthine dehydrogenase FAD-binding subunit
MFDLKVLHRPTSPGEAVRLFKETEGTGLYVAGGTVVVPAASPNLDFLVDLSEAGLSYVSSRSGRLVLGATVTAGSLGRSLEAGGIASGLLPAAALSIGNHTVRNLATVGGNIASWPYPTDLPVALLVMNASLTVLSGSGSREVALGDFLAKRGSVFQKGDLITEIAMPVPARGTSGGFEKIGRKRLDVAVVNAAAALRLEGRRIAEAAVAVGALGPAPARLAECEDYLRGKEVCEETLAEAGRMVSASVSPRSDHRAGAEYRKRAAGVAAKRAIMRAAGLLPGEAPSRTRTT